MVWIGLPENLPYLELVRPALARLAARGVVLRLRVVCSAFPEWRDVPIERVPWSSATEGAALAEAAIGIIPLAADLVERGARTADGATRAAQPPRSSAPG